MFNNNRLRNPQPSSPFQAPGGQYKRNPVTSHKACSNIYIIYTHFIPSVHNCPFRISSTAFDFVTQNKRLFSQYSQYYLIHIFINIKVKEDPTYCMKA